MRGFKFIDAGSITAENTDQVVVGMRSGTLPIFPCWLEHSVDANPNEAERS